MKQTGKSYLGKMYFSPAMLLSIVLSVILFSVPPSHAKEKVTLQLAWKHQFQFAGYYAALHKGFYEKSGLDVTIVEGGEGKFAREEVLNGNAHYGVAGAELLLHRRDGDPFVVLAPIFQHSASILLSKSDTGVAHLQDLVGKKVMLLPENKDADILVAFLNEGIALDQIHRLDQTYNLDDLIEKRTDAVSAYSTNEPWFLLKKDITPAVISPQTYGVDFYSDCLFTTEKEIDSHPQRVETFLKASLQGWEYAMNNPEEIIDLLYATYAVQKDRDHLRFEADEIRKLMMPDLVQIGHMNPGRWEHIKKTYARLGLIEKDFPLVGFLYDPHPTVDYTWLKRLLVVFVPLFCALIIFVLFLVNFNRKLSSEVALRKQIEKELKKSELLHKKAQSVAKIGHWELDSPSGTPMWSEEIYHIFGLDPQTSAPSFTAHKDIVHADDWPLLERSIQELASHGTPFDIEFRIKRSDDQIGWMHAIGAAEKDTNNGVLRMFGIAQDITDRKTLESQLLQSQKLESIGTLAGGIAHEFNNILSIIIGNNELIMDELPEHSLSRQSSDEIRLAGLRARDVVRHLLTFSRQDDATKKPIDIGAVVAESLRLIRATTPTNIEIRERISPHCDPVFGNSTQINQILINLCNNAVDALPISGGTIEVALDNIAIDHHSGQSKTPLRPGPYVRLMVRDNGSGIAAPIQNRIFEPYFTTKDVGKGSGIGLAVVHGIVKDHGGTIVCESDTDLGTTFTILIPAHEGHAVQEQDKHDNFPGNGEKILYVDDEPSLAKLGMRHLQALGYDAVSLTDPSEALKAIAAEPDTFDLVISDLAMPIMPGDQLAAEILKVAPQMPIIICTGYSSRMSEKEALDMGIQAFLLKPLNKSELAQKVRDVLMARA